MRVSDFAFDLPEELIAQRPPARRGTSRMLSFDRQTGAVADRTFADLPAILRPGDLLVLNDSRVLPARLFATRGGLRTQAGTPRPEGLVEVLLTERIGETRKTGDAQRWRALVRPAKKVSVGEVLFFAAPPGAQGVGEALLRAEVMEAGAFGERLLRFDPHPGFLQILERIGHLPLPPYIRRKRTEPNTTEDRERYQTVYSVPFRVSDGGHRQGSYEDDTGGNGETQIPFGNDNKGDSGSGKGKGEAERQQVAGSAAAPTAGLHFTPEILGQLAHRGVEVARVTLHVGLGTFQPVRVERTEEIRLHAESYTLSSETAAALNRAVRENRRIVAVGTTTTRTLEHLARRFEAEHGAVSGTNPLHLEPHSGATSLFLSPGPDGDDRFRLVQGLLTNFHLPESTLLVLVSAFAGRERVLAAYAHAVRERYRFFSYGDCMLFL